MFTLKIDDGICKGFKNEDGVDIFINKAFDDESNTHSLLIYIPNLPKYNIAHLRDLLTYENEEQRDGAYTHNMNDEFINMYYQALEKHIEESKNKKE